MARKAVLGGMMDLGEIRVGRVRRRARAEYMDVADEEGESKSPASPDGKCPLLPFLLRSQTFPLCFS
jgi:hypothetical protein